MNLKTLTDLVKNSTLLGEDERTYWLNNMPNMTPKQLQKLESILKDVDETPFQKQLEQYFQKLGKTAESALQKPMAA